MTPLLSLIAALLSAAPDPNQPFDLTVTLDQHDPKRGGTLICALFTTEAGFPLETSKAAQVVQARIEGPRATCTFQLERAALVAVSVAHDENGNKTVDRNFFGVPLEGWASSNNVKPALRPPTFAESRVQASPERSSLSVTLHY